MNILSFLTFLLLNSTFASSIYRNNLPYPILQNKFNLMGYYKPQMPRYKFNRNFNFPPSYYGSRYNFNPRNFNRQFNQPRPNYKSYGSAGWKRPYMLDRFGNK